jgi:hypothetical protein
MCSISIERRFNEVAMVYGDGKERSGRTSGHPMESGALLRLDGLKHFDWIERRRRIDDLGSMC